MRALPPLPRSKHNPAGTSASPEDLAEAVLLRLPDDVWKRVEARQIADNLAEGGTTGDLVVDSWEQLASEIPDDLDELERKILAGMKK